MIQYDMKSWWHKCHLWYFLLSDDMYIYIYICIVWHYDQSHWYIFMAIILQVHGSLSIFKHIHSVGKWSIYTSTKFHPRSRDVRLIMMASAGPKGLGGAVPIKKWTKKKTEFRVVKGLYPPFITSPGPLKSVGSTVRSDSPSGEVSLT